MVHRLAFRSLIGLHPSPEDCLIWFEAHRDAFEAAARARIAAGVAGNFHLTSRDITGQLGAISR